MEIKPIKTEADYRAALEEIERLFDAAPDTPEGDRLEVLTALVEAYEEKHYTIPPPDPIEAIKYYIESRPDAARLGAVHREPKSCFRDLEPETAACPHDDTAASCGAWDSGGGADTAV